MKELHRSLPAKVGAIFLTVICGVFSVLSVLGIILSWEAGFYQGASDYLTSRPVTEMALGRLRPVAADLTQAQNEGTLESYLNSLPTQWENSNLQFSVWKNGVFLGSSRTGSAGKDETAVTDPLAGEKTAVCTSQGYEFHYYVDTTFPTADSFSTFYLVYRFLYPLRWGLIGLAGINVLGFFAALVFLFCAAGWRKGADYPQLNYFDRVPLDVWLCAALTIWVLGLSVIGTMYYPEVLTIAFCGAVVVLLWLVLLATLLTLCTRIKVGKWWRGTLTYRVWRLVCRIISAIGRGISGATRALPLVWRTALISAGVFFLGFSLTLVGGFWYSGQAMLLYFLLGGCAVLFLCYDSFQMQKLRRAGRALAQGTFDTAVDTRHMPPALREHGEDLNSLGQGLAIAVEQRLRSERLKTELITNVSHDIKTPLTSIINYVDLLQKPHSDEEGAQYLSVLDRQAKRLKKLIEDLVEASKASTGNLPVSLVPTDLHEIINQAAGEYEDKLAQAKLDLVVTGDGERISAMADGRLLWRVLDNLLNNACKYALPGTRVYLETRRVEGRAVITMKNISRQQLNLSPDELMERFVRGDSSRNTEGSGLGLNIAQSLVELMLGHFSLDIDGDLFKAVISLPLVPNDTGKELTVS